MSGNIVADNTVCIGGNTGIGFEIVRKLSSEYPSYHILTGSRDVHKVEDAASSLGAPTNINPIQLDVTDDASINLCLKAVGQHFGPPRCPHQQCWYCWSRPQRRARPRQLEGSLQPLLQRQCHQRSDSHRDHASTPAGIEATQNHLYQL